MKYVPHRLYWRIEGYSGTEKFFEQIEPGHYASERQMRSILRNLACRHLTDEEIVWASVNRKSPSRNLLLDEVGRPSADSRYTLCFGTDPYYVAASFRGHELSET